VAAGEARAEAHTQAGPAEADTQGAAARNREAGNLQSICGPTAPDAFPAGNWQHKRSTRARRRATQ
jgi:hypothetical protein